MQFLVEKGEKNDIALILVTRRIYFVSNDWDNKNQGFKVKNSGN